METLSSRLHTSRKALEQESGLLAKRTRTASQTFARQTRRASKTLVHTTDEAARQFGSAVATEAAAWRTFAGDRRQRASTEARDLLSARGVERRVLGRLDAALSGASERLRTRLAHVSAEASKAPPVDATAAEPIRGYDGLTAREVIAELSSLPATRRERVIAYEQAHKARATVIRAARAA